MAPLSSFFELKPYMSVLDLGGNCTCLGIYTEYISSEEYECNCTLNYTNNKKTLIKQN